MITDGSERTPPGPSDRYDSNDDLLTWMGGQFERFGDTFKASVYGTIVYGTRAPKHAEHVLLKNWQNYKKGQAIKRVALLLGKGLMVSEGDFWKNQRRMIQPSFSGATRSTELMQTITSANSELLAKWERAADQHEQIDVTSDVSRMVLNLVLASIFGRDHDEVFAATLFIVLSEEGVRDLEFAERFRALGSTIVGVASTRRRQGFVGRDFLGMLMAARARDTGEPMSDQQLVNEIMTLIVAGHETTASTLNWVWHLLSENPLVERRLAAELRNVTPDDLQDLDRLPNFTYTRAVIEEALRLYPAGWLLTRKALNDDQLGEFFVPRGTEIYLPLYFIQRHPDLWADANRFDPDRFTPDNQHKRHTLSMIPFSAGPRNCIGESFARVEMQVHVMMIAQRLRLKGVAGLTPELDVGVNLRSKHHFVMTPERMPGLVG